MSGSLVTTDFLTLLAAYAVFIVVTLSLSR